VKSDPGLLAAVAARIGGSPDIYQERGQTPENSINFVTVHDGFTMNDLVSYQTKHNEANGEGNRDGIDKQPELELRRGGADDQSWDRAVRERQSETSSRSC